MRKKAFTLVELIIVITILAILATIGFINLHGYTSGARDSKRISELSEIRNGLHIYQARNSVVPIPSEERVTIGSGATNLVIQGYIGQSVLKEIRMSSITKDSYDDVYYTYSTSYDLKSFQLLTFLENTNFSYFDDINFINTANAANNNENRYLNRKPYTLGNIVGILLNENNIPIQELGIENINLNDDEGEYKVLIGDESYEGNGEEIYDKIVNFTNNKGISYNYSCDTQPNYNNANFIYGNPNQENQAWQNINSNGGCYYECIGNYSGNDCETYNDQVRLDIDVYNGVSGNNSGFSWSSGRLLPSTLSDHRRHYANCTRSSNATYASVRVGPNGGCNSSLIMSQHGTGPLIFDIQEGENFDISFTIYRISTETNYRAIFRIPNIFTWNYFRDGASSFSVSGLPSGTVPIGSTTTQHNFRIVYEGQHLRAYRNGILYGERFDYNYVPTTQTQKIEMGAWSSELRIRNLKIKIRE